MPKRSETLERIDLELGQKIRARRKFLGMSQSDLAKAIGVTFGQIQKYEKGKTTASARRLQAILVALEMPVSALFESTTPFVSPRPTPLFGTEHSNVTKLLTSPEGVELSRAFTSIANPRLRKSIVSLIEAIAHQIQE